MRSLPIQLQRIISLTLVFMGATIGWSQILTNDGDVLLKTPNGDRIILSAEQYAMVTNKNYYTGNHHVVATNDVNREWGQTVEGYALSITTSNKIFITGEPIILNVSRKNMAEKDLPISL